MSALLDLVGEVRAAVDGSPDPKALRVRLLGELRQRYPDVVASARSQTDASVFEYVLTEHPDIVERCRHLLVHSDTVGPLEAIVSGVMTEAMAGLEPAVTLAMGRRYRVSWADGSTVVTGGDGRRWRVSWPADGIGVDLDEI